MAKKRKRLKPRRLLKGESLQEAKKLVKKVQKAHAGFTKADRKKLAKQMSKLKKRTLAGVKPKKGRTRAYLLPKARIVDEAKMDAQLKRLKERKLVPRSATSLVGVRLVRPYNGKKYVVKGTRKGWLRLDTGKYFPSLFAAACNIVDGPRNGYLFFQDALKQAEIN